MVGRNDAKFLSDWSNRSSMSYQEFLQAQQFEKSIKFGIDSQTRELIASNEEFLARGFSAVSESLDLGFVAISRDISALHEEMGLIRGAIEWGITEVLLSLGHIGDQLTELLKIARTPSQIWAYEQFDIARDEFRRGLFPEALESVTRAIEGHGSNIGYRTEFRFHFLLGVLRLGDYRNCTSTMIDPEAAELAFSNAARYAQADFGADAGLALISAGRAALIQEKIDQAIDCTERGLALLPEDPSGLFQMARLLCIRGKNVAGAEYLERAILIDTKPALSAASLPEFSPKESPDLVPAVLRRATKTYQDRYANVRQQFESALQAVRKLSFRDQTGSVVLQDKVAELVNLATSHSPANRLFAYEQAVARIHESKVMFDGLPSLFTSRVRKVYEAKRAIARESLTVLRTQKEQANSRDIGCAGSAMGCLVPLGCAVCANLFFGLVALSNPGSYGWNSITVVSGLLGILASLGAAGTLANSDGVVRYFERSEREARSRKSAEKYDGDLRAHEGRLRAIEAEIVALLASPHHPVWPEEALTPGGQRRLT